MLKGIAEVFRAELRHYDVPARFGGEEFSILLPETPPEQALEIAERIRRAIADRLFESRPRATDPATVSSASPASRRTPRIRTAHPPGRPRRVPRQAAGAKSGPHASSEPLLMPADRSVPLVSVPRTATTTSRWRGFRRPSGARAPPHGPHDQRTALPAAFDPPGPARRPRTLRRRGGRLGILFGTSTDIIGLLAVIALVGVGRRSRSSSTTARSPSAPSVRSQAQRSSARAVRSRSRLPSAPSSGAPIAVRSTRCSSTSAR